MPPAEVHHVVEGSEAAPAIVFVNSLGTDLEMWDPQARALDADFRVVRFDARGHGRSPVPAGPYSLADLGGDLIGLLDRLEIERASLCGVSLGGATAVWVAAHAPERVESLVACFTAASFGPPEPWRERAALVRSQGTEAVADGVLRRWFTPAFAEREPELLARMRTTLVATSAAGYAACCEVVGEIDLGGDLELIAAPTLVMSGTEDVVSPPAHGRRLAAGIAAAEFAEIPGAAHIGNLERPAMVSDLIRAHLAPVLHRSQTKEAQ
jgi:3-oxoadipate enol-lactonase